MRLRFSVVEYRLCIWSILSIGTFQASGSKMGMKCLHHSVSALWVREGERWNAGFSFANTNSAVLQCSSAAIRCRLKSAAKTKVYGPLGTPAVGSIALPASSQASIGQSHLSAAERYEIAGMPPSFLVKLSARSQVVQVLTRGDQVFLMIFIHLFELF